MAKIVVGHLKTKQFCLQTTGNLQLEIYELCVFSFQLSEGEATRVISLLMISALPLNLAASYTVVHCRQLRLLQHQSLRLLPTTVNQLSLLALVMVNVSRKAKSVTSTWIVLMALMRDLAVSMPNDCGILRKFGVLNFSINSFNYFFSSLAFARL